MRWYLPLCCCALAPSLWAATAAPHQAETPGTPTITPHATATPTHAQAGPGWDGNFSLAAGEKQLGAEDWAPYDAQAETVLSLDMAPTHWPFHIAISTASASKIDDYAATYSSEYAVGIRKYGKGWIWTQGNGFVPFVGAGACFVEARVEIYQAGGTDTERGSGFGFWIDGGLQYRFTNNVHVELQYRYSRAEVTLYQENREAGGTHLLLGVGFHW